MIKAGIDQEAIVKMFSEATAKQGEALRKAVSDATLKALQGRELTMENIKKVLKTVTTAATTGAAQNGGNPVDVEAMLGTAFAGMDSALLQAVEANRKALEQFVSQGVGLSEKPMKAALANLEKMEDAFFESIAKAGKSAGPLQGPWEQALANVEKMEDAFFAAVSKASQSAGPLQGPWQNALDAMKMKGSATGNQATQTVEQLMGQAQTMLREGRASGMRAAQAMLDSYAALASGVLIGMSEGLQAGSKKSGGSGSGAGSASASSAAPSAAAKSAARGRRR